MYILEMLVLKVLLLKVYGKFWFKKHECMDVSFLVADNFSSSLTKLIGLQRSNIHDESGELIFYSLIDERNGNVYLVSRKSGIEFPGGEYRS